MRGFSRGDGANLPAAASAPLGARVIPEIRLVRDQKERARDDAGRTAGMQDSTRCGKLDAMPSVSHVVAVPPGPFPIAGSSVEVHCVPMARDNLGWLLVDPRAGAAAIVDGPEAASALSACEALGVRLAAVLNTHTHGDHIGVNRDLERRGLLGALRVVGPAAARDAVPGLTEAVDEGDAVDFGDLRLRVLRTDGHLDGHISFVGGDALFPGDTLFTAGCGYLFSGPAAAMHESLSRLAALPPDTRVFCAHEYTLDNLAFARSVDPDNPALAARIARTVLLRREGRSAVPSTVGEERATNPFLRSFEPSILASLRHTMPESSLQTPAEAFAAARALKNLKRYEPIAG